MIDTLLVVTGVILAVLLAATTYATYEYYKQLRKAQTEYVKARDMVEDIVLSFNRQLKREADKLQTVAFKVEVAGLTANAGISKAETVEKRLTPVEAKISTVDSQIESLKAVITSLSDASAKTLEQLASADTNALGAKVQDVESAQETLKVKVAGLEDQVQKLAATPEARFEVLTPLPVMPIKRDKAMAALTDTEVAVLEFLSSEGPKTAPEIKEKVQLSREHTARLMKRLYEEGYLERETVKLPFKYSVKKEMEKLLRKPEPPNFTG
jgi:hypothetical protein